MKFRLLVFSVLAGIAPAIALADCASYSVLSSLQGTEWDGSPIPGYRSDPDNVLGGVPDNSFFSLGFNPHGEIVVELDEAYVSGTLTIWETTWGSYCLETAMVYVGDGTNWIYVGSADNDYRAGGDHHPSEFGFDFGDCPGTCINQVKIVDTTDPTLPPPCGPSSDGFDVDAICVEGTLCEQTVEAEEQPVNWSLDQNYPNPFNPATTIAFRLDETGMVDLKIYNMTGTLVKTLVSGLKERGEHSVEFDAGDLESGVYFYTLETEGLLQTRKMVLLK